MANLVNVDSPDIVKSQYKACLSFKEVKDALFKFLQQADIPFSEGERLRLNTQFNLKKFSINLSTQAYSVDCKLNDITVDGQPIYIVVTSIPYENLNNGHRNRLIALGQEYKIVIFDETDWREIGLDISDKEWLKPLTAPLMRRWAKKLFKKISELGSSIESSFNLNDIFEAIARNTADVSYSSTYLEKENFKLRKELRKEKLSRRFPITPHQDPLIEFLVNTNRSSSLFIQEVVGLVIDPILKSIDLRQSFFRDLLGVDITATPDRAKITTYVEQELSKRKQNISVINCGGGVLKIQSKKTFQSLILTLAISTSDKLPTLKIASDVIQEGSGMFNLVLFFCKEKRKLNGIRCYVTLKNLCSKKGGFTKEHRLCIYNSKYKEPFKLWLEE